MSKNRKSPNATARNQGCKRIVSVGVNARLIKIPQTSSMTIQPGSSVPVSFMAFFTKGMAAKKTMRAAVRNVKLIWKKKPKNIESLRWNNSSVMDAMG